MKDVELDLLKDSPDYEDYTENIAQPKKGKCCGKGCSKCSGCGNIKSGIEIKKA